jgi:hypothetical protein
LQKLARKFVVVLIWQAAPPVGKINERVNGRFLGINGFLNFARSFELESDRRFFTEYMHNVC